MHSKNIFEHQNNTLILNYFAILHDKKKKLLDDAFNLPIEELEIDNTFQFFTSDFEYGDTMNPVIKCLDHNKNIKTIIFKLSEKDGSEKHEVFEGPWRYYESSRLKKFILDLLNNFPQLNIIIRHNSFKEVLKDPKKLSVYLEIFELHRLLDENPSTKNKFEIDGFSKSEIKKIIDRYFLEVADTIVVIEDNVGWNDSSAVRDIELISRSYNFERENSEFLINLGLKKIKVSVDGEEPFIKEGKFLYDMNWSDKFRSYGNEKFYHFLNQRIEGIDADQAIIFVKQKYLDEVKTTIFKNIKHYFYFCETTYSYDKNDNIQFNKFWKDNDYFYLPSSVKFNKLETLNICGGRNIELSNLFKDIDSSHLKQLVITNCVIKERKFPSFLNLENLVIEDKFSSKAQSFTKFSNLPNLKNLLLLNLYHCDDATGRWMTTEFDFTDIYKLSKLEYLKMSLVNPQYLEDLKHLKNLQELDLSFHLITKNNKADDGFFNKNLVDKDFKFLNHLNKLKKIELFFPVYNSNVKGPLALSYVNKKIEELSLILHYEDKDIKYGNETIRYITKYFKNLKLLKLVMGRNENFETDDKTKMVCMKKTGEKWKEGELGPRPFILDLNQFTSLKRLERIGFSETWGDEMGFKVINPVSITKLKNITNIHINEEKFSSKDLIAIKNITEVPRDKFLEECKKKDKSIINEYKLPAKDKKKYDSLDRAISFGGYIEAKWSGKSIEEILKQRKVKIKNVN